jgi:hypothetical protein
MHVHLAEVFSSMMDAIEKVHKAGNSSAYIACKDKQTSNCSISDKAQRDTTSIKVRVSRHAQPPDGDPSGHLNCFGRI